MNCSWQCLYSLTKGNKTKPWPCPYANVFLETENEVCLGLFVKQSHCVFHKENPTAIPVFINHLILLLRWDPGFQLVVWCKTEHCTLKLIQVYAWEIVTCAVEREGTTEEIFLLQLLNTSSWRMALGYKHFALDIMNYQAEHRYDVTHHV